MRHASIKSIQFCIKNLLALIYTLFVSHSNGNKLRKKINVECWQFLSIWIKMVIFGKICKLLPIAWLKHSYMEFVWMCASQEFYLILCLLSFWIIAKEWKHIANIRLSVKVANRLSKITLVQITMRINATIEWLIQKLRSFFANYSDLNPHYAVTFSHPHPRMIHLSLQISWKDLRWWSQCFDKLFMHFIWHTQLFDTVQTVACFS